MNKILFTLLLFSCHFLQGQITIRIKPDATKGKDAILATVPAFTGMNFGKTKTFISAEWTWSGVPGADYLFLDFDWSLLPANSSFQAANIKLFAYNGDGGNQEYHSKLSGPNDAWLERIVTPWDELTLTNTTPYTIDSTIRVAIPPSDSVNQDYDIDVTNMVQEMFTDLSKAHGFIMRMQVPHYYRMLSFCSSDVSDPSKWPEITFTFTAPGVSGVVYQESNGNCIREITEKGLANRIIEIQPGGYIVQTNDAGIWHIDLPNGNYTATLLNNDAYWSADCTSSFNFSVTDPNTMVTAPDIALTPAQSCSQPNISVYSNILRRCFSEQEIYVDASNSFLATSSMNDAYAEITLDSLFTLDSASIAYTALSGNVYRFNLDTLDPGTSKRFTMYVTLSCDAVLLETLCHEARLFPADSCAFDTIPNPTPPDFTPCTLPWDKSSLKVEGWCSNDTIYFVVINHGTGDMDCYSPVRVYLDGSLYLFDSIQLASGDSVVYSFAGNGQTWILEADQHPLHPGNSHPNAHVERCGNPTNWTPDLINNFPQDDADPVIDIFCTVTNGAYDPNDKRGFPQGISESHYIKPNQQLEYIIRFQNTGTDTAFTVVIRDTLDTDLDISSVRTGVSSHNQTFRMYGSRVLEWRFDNILLVDSNTNEPASHGFVTFTVNQLKDLPDGTSIDNEADIYFDFNVPVITNNAHHEVNRQIYDLLNGVIEAQEFTNGVYLYPNPANETVNIWSEQIVQGKVTILNVNGQLIEEKMINGQTLQLDLNRLQSGVYLVRLERQGITNTLRFVKQ